MLTIEQIISQVRAYEPKVDSVLLLRSFQFANKLYEGMYRLSGDPYISHALAVTHLLLPLRPDQATIIASLLHGAHKSPHFDLKEIQTLFGDDVVFLLEGIQRLRKLVLKNTHTEVEVLRKMVISLSQDLRVVLIRLADILRNMDTLDYVPIKERKELAHQAMDIFVPIASRLGVYHIKTRLEDLAFSYLDPDQYLDLKQQLEQYVRKQEKIVEQFKVELEAFLNQQGIQSKIEGRLKSLYSIYKKLKRKSRTTLRDIYDVFAFRIILPTFYDQTGVESTEHLYTLLGLIHNKWAPLLSRFKDYVAVPKPNGYRSLHTTIIGFTSDAFDQPIEIQIRSQKMHEQAEFGIASHWLYEQTKGASSFFKVDPADDHVDLSKYQGWFQDLNQSGITEVKLHLFEDRIFVFTPKGEVKDLPLNATPVDFAYAIHTDIGHRCIGAKVNGSIVPLNHPLKNGDIIEILTKNKVDPKPHWLSFVQSVHAKNKIKTYLKSLDKDRSLRDGKELLNKALKNMGLPLLDESFSIFRHYGEQKLSLQERRGLVEEIGNGSVYLPAVLKKVFGSSEKPVEKLKKQKAGVKISTAVIAAPLNQVYVAGQSNVPYKISLCCKPKNGDAIVAYVSRGNSLRIHLKTCKLLREADQQRLLEASWGLRGYTSPQYRAKIAVKALDRVGLLRDIADAIASFNVNIADLTLKNRNDSYIHREMILEVTDKEELQKILEQLRQVKNVIKVTTL